jgi:hypothetical protein|tara:strand:- start:315 stop:575 length:261 start_codon:yes stop_codon:yes gene_type:complete
MHFYRQHDELQVSTQVFTHTPRVTTPPSTTFTLFTDQGGIDHPVLVFEVLVFQRHVLCCNGAYVQTTFQTSERNDKIHHRPKLLAA